MTTNEFDHMKWSTIPNPAMRSGLERYLTHGLLPGDFLSALLRNDLVDTFAHADRINSELIREWAKWIYWEFPSTAWGSKEIMLAWSKERQAKA